MGLASDGTAENSPQVREVLLQSSCEDAGIQPTPDAGVAQPADSGLAEEPDSGANFSAVKLTVGFSCESASTGQMLSLAAGLLLVFFKKRTPTKGSTHQS